MDRELDVRLDGAMLDIYRRAKAEAGYNATRYLQMLDVHRGVEKARILLRAHDVSEGYLALWKRGRLDLTVEALVLKPEFERLFTDDERAIAHQRLTDFGYALPAEPSP